MLKFDLTNADGLSAFAKTLKHQFIDKNIDIRTAKDSKVLHRVAETLGFSNWAELKQHLEAGTTQLTQSTNSTQSTIALSDIIDVSSPERVNEAIYGVAVEAGKIRFVLGSELSIDFHKHHKNITRIEIVERSFGEDDKTFPLTDEAFEQAKQLFAEPLSDALSINERW